MEAWVGLILFGLIVLAAVAFGIAGLVVYRKGSSWFIKALGILTALMGLIIALTLVIGLIVQADPFKAVFVMLVTGIGLAATLFWVAMLVEAALYEKSSNDRLLWVIVIIFTNVIGAFIYLLARRPQRIAEGGG